MKDNKDRQILESFKDCLGQEVYVGDICIAAMQKWSTDSNSYVVALFPVIIFMIYKEEREHYLESPKEFLKIQVYTDSKKEFRLFEDNFGDNSGFLCKIDNPYFFLNDRRIANLIKLKSRL